MAPSNAAHAIAPSVGSENELKRAIDAAHARVQAVYANGSNTLVDEIPSHVWQNWNATDEDATVADDTLEDFDPVDLDCETREAA